MNGVAKAQINNDSHNAKSYKLKCNLKINPCINIYICVYVYYTDIETVTNKYDFKPFFKIDTSEKLLLLHKRPPASQTWWVYHSVKTTWFNSACSNFHINCNNNNNPNMVTSWLYKVIKNYRPYKKVIFISHYRN